MKSKFFYSIVIVLLMSLVQFDLPNAFGGEINYKKIYENQCRKCHELDGKGTKRGKGLGVPDFTDPEWQASVTDEQLVNSITKGKKKMPKQEGRLSPEEIKAMVKYIRFFGPKKKR
jgi:cytochrome c6